MSASHALNPDQFGHVVSHDYDRPMSEVSENTLGFAGRDKARSIQAHLESGGKVPPVTMDFGADPPKLHDGHHRWVAARAAGVPVPYETLKRHAPPA